MKHYIMLSFITGSGGVQCYVASKARYLEEHGWRVVVISDNNPKENDKCLINSLNKYLPNGNPYQNLQACYIPHYQVKKALKRYLDVVGSISEGEEVIIESWNSQTAIWGELIAKRLRARHVFWTANENYRQVGHSYVAKMDFFMFKMDRGEVLTNLSIANKLFDGFRVYKEDDFLETIITEDPIQDVDSPEIDSIVKADWNICYIGRSNKTYVPNIFKGVGEFANNHKEKRIQFIIVGKVITNKEVLQDLKSLDNLIVTELGDLYPMPRALYSKIDVVIAGSGSARHSADEGALVITADSILNNSHGLLGYDTNESIYKEEGTMDYSFNEAIERALVKKTWKQQKYKWVRMPGIKECTERQFEIINRANPNLEYYDEKELLKGKVDYFLLLRSLYGRIRKLLVNK
jgi:hypothetical protein